MKTLIELKQAAESKGLRFEVNKWDPTIRRWETDKVPNPDFMKIELVLSTVLTSGHGLTGSVRKMSRMMI